MDFEKIKAWFFSNLPFLLMGFILVGAIGVTMYKAAKRKKSIYRKMAAARRAKKSKGRKKR